MSQTHLNSFAGHRGTGFAGPLVVPPGGGGAAGASGGGQ
jgi:hypothetical protein